MNIFTVFPSFFCSLVNACLNASGFLIISVLAGLSELVYTIRIYWIFYIFIFDSTFIFSWSAIGRRGWFIIFTELRNKKRKIKKMVLYIVCVLLCALMIFPLLWGVTSSFRTDDELFKYLMPLSWKTFVPQNITFDAYIRIF